MQGHIPVFCEQSGFRDELHPLSRAEAFAAITTAALCLRKFCDTLTKAAVVGFLFLL